MRHIGDIVATPVRYHFARHSVLAAMVLLGMLSCGPPAEPRADATAPDDDASSTPRSEPGSPVAHTDPEIGRVTTRATFLDGQVVVRPAPAGMEPITSADGAIAAFTAGGGYSRAWDEATRIQVEFGLLDHSTPSTIHSTAPRFDDEPVWLLHFHDVSDRGTGQPGHPAPPEVLQDVMSFVRDSDGVVLFTVSEPPQ